MNIMYIFGEYNIFQNPFNSVHSVFVLIGYQRNDNNNQLICIYFGVILINHYSFIHHQINKTIPVFFFVC